MASYAATVLALEVAGSRSGAVGGVRRGEGTAGQGEDDGDCANPRWTEVAAMLCVGGSRDAWFTDRYSCVAAAHAARDAGPDREKGKAAAYFIS